MSLRRLMIFDDGHGQFGPLTDLRPAFDLRCGALSARRRIEQLIGRSADVLIVPADYQAITLRTSECDAVNTQAPTPGAWLVINGRCLDPDVLQRAARLALGQSFKQEDGQLVAAHVEFKTDAISWELPDDLKSSLLTGRVLIERPWHLLASLELALDSDLSAIDLPVIRTTPHGVVQFGDHPLKVHPSARLQPAAVFNTERGAIIIEADVTIAATAVIEGPCYFGPGTRVAPATYLRGPCVIGPRCRLGGEISHTIMQGYSNKAHQGHLGHSIVGRWVNFGADTNVSNLKNTYGNVRVKFAADQPAQDTELTFFGGIFGDFVRTAVGTRITTGSVINTGSMLAISGFSPTFVDRFRFMTDKGDEPYDVEKFISTARAMMSRREVALDSALESRLRDLAQLNAQDTDSQPGLWRLAR